MLTNPGSTSPASPASHDIVLDDSVLREIDWADPARLARGLESAGASHISLLESALPESPWGIWTFLSWNPSAALEHRNGDWIVVSSAGATVSGTIAAFPAIAAFEETLRADPSHPFEQLARGFDTLAGASTDRVGAGAATREAPRPPFRGGLFVALSYDAARSLDDFQPWADRAAADLEWPWFDVRLTPGLLAFHHPSGRAFAVAARHVAFGPPETTLERLVAEVAAAVRTLADSGGSGTGGLAASFASASASELSSNMTDAQYGAAFGRLQEYLRAGDLYQANLTRRFDAPCDERGSLLYARLRERARAPYGALFTAPDRAVVSASPELFLAGDGQRLVTRPIKGTRPRGGDGTEDARLIAELKASEKDRAEHVMIVDVHRNDLGRVCEFGTVKVETLAGHEVFLTVHHLTSTIAGVMRPGVPSWRAIAAAYPAGSITGAPKRRAIEILEELEPTRRAQYTGSMGWMGMDGTFGLNVAIRTILTTRGRAYYQAGGGIVVDSKLEEEAAETWSKARAMHAAVSARGG